MKKILPVALALFALLTAIPVLPASAAGNTRLSVSPTDARADLGSDFTVSALLTDAPDVCGYDITLRYNNQVLSVVSTSLGHTLFDLEDDGDVLSDVNGDGINDVFVARADVEQIIGRIRYALVLVAVPGITIGGTPESLLSVTFHVESEGSSALDLSNDIVVRCSGARGSESQPHATTDGTYNLPAVLSLLGCSPQSRVINKQTGPVQTITCTVMNTGAGDETGRIDFLYQSRAGQVGSGSTEASIPAGMTMTLDFQITSAECNDKVFVVSSLFRVHTTMSGPLDVPAGSGPTFFNVQNLC